MYQGIVPPLKSMQKITSHIRAFRGFSVCRGLIRYGKAVRIEAIVKKN
jgi:hypothetical protein